MHWSPFGSRHDRWKVQCQAPSPGLRTCRLLRRRACTSGTACRGPRRHVAALPRRAPRARRRSSADDPRLRRPRERPGRPAYRVGGQPELGCRGLWTGRCRAFPASLRVHGRCIANILRCMRCTVKGGSRESHQRTVFLAVSMAFATAACSIFMVKLVVCADQPVYCGPQRARVRGPRDARNESPEKARHYSLHDLLYL